jgi:aspartate aminotransferase
MDLLERLDVLPDDPILGLTVSFLADPRKDKINLGVGTYKDAEGRACVFTAVTDAEKQLLDSHLDKEYLPITGKKEFYQLLSEVILGEEKEKVTFAAQTLGGSGALRIGGELLARSGVKKIYLSDPTWSNHKLLFQAAGLTVDTYPYYEPMSSSIKMKAMEEAILQMPQHSAILLQGCCHNPTGFDLSPKQWDNLLDLIKEKKLIPFFDVAYQGLGQGVKEDAYPWRLFAKHNVAMLISYSCSKTFGLYGERTGGLFFINFPKAEKQIESQIKNIVRSSYSTPPLHGQRVICHLLANQNLKNDWEAELNSIRARIQEMRNAFVAALLAKGPSGRFDFMHHQRGLFSYSGLTPDQVMRLKSEWGIYMPSNGRINVAGLNWHNLDRVVEGILSAIEL